MASYKVFISYDQRDFPLLKGLTDGDGKFLIPQDVELDEASLVITATYAELGYFYRARTADGKQHKRRTSGQVRFPPGEAGVGWLAMLWPRSNGGSRRDVGQALGDLWPQAPVKRPTSEEA